MGHVILSRQAFSGRIGLVFPHSVVGADQAAIVEFARAAQEAGIEYLAVPSHDLGVDPASHRERLAADWPFPKASGPRGVPYKDTDPFHEPFTLCAYLGALCDLYFLTAVVVLPQRQTVAVAKAAAEVDILTSGRLVLGVGAGWNSVEMAAVGACYTDRFARLDEQIEVLRRLWTDDIVVFEGRHHQLSGVTLLPKPVRRPIPIWIGSGGGARSLARVAALADGWLPQMVPGHGLETSLEEVRRGMGALDRDPDALALHGVVMVAGADLPTVARRASAWAAAGATHIALDLRGARTDTDDLHGFVDTVRNG